MCTCRVLKVNTSLWVDPNGTVKSHTIQWLPCECAQCWWVGGCPTPVLVQRAVLVHFTQKETPRGCGCVVLVSAEACKARRHVCVHLQTGQTATHATRLCLLTDWTNGNVPLVALIRAAGPDAVKKLDSDLDLGGVVDGYVQSILAHTNKTNGWIGP